MDLATLAVLTLATWQTVEIVHHGAIFESLRARWTAMIPWTAVESHFPRRRWFHRRLWAVKVFRADLLRCPFCLSVWAAAACLLLLQCRWTSWFVFVLAASRAANALNDVCRPVTRTPGRKNEDH